MNDFYKQPKLLQWMEASLLLVVGFMPALVIFEFGYTQPLFYLLFIVYVPISQFTFTPIFRLTGVYKYYSPMLLGYMANDLQIDLHSGGSFDYLFVMRKYTAGIDLKTKLLMFHIEGLLKIIQLIENKSIPETVNIIGTSYFFNDRTTQKIGFEIVKPSLFYRLNLFINFIDLVWMYSLSKRKFSIHKLWNAKKASISGTKLIESKRLLEDLYEKMRTKSKHNHGFS
jgi:hypothetical protein